MTGVSGSHGPARGAGHGGAARGYSWAPFEAGNAVSLRHGARSPRVYGTLAEELAAGMVHDRPDLAAYPEALAAWATAEAQAALLRRHLDDAGLFDGAGKVRGALDHLDRVERRADRMRQRLGLDPRAEADLAHALASAASVAVDLEAIADRGRAVLAERGPDDRPPDLAGRALAGVLQAGRTTDDRGGDDDA